MPLPEILFDGGALSLDDIASISRREAVARLSDAPAFQRRIDAGAEFIARHDLKGQVEEEYRALRHVWVALAPA